MNNQKDNFFAPMSITVDCTVCKQRKLMMVSILELGKFQPQEERKKLVYSGVCRLCQAKASMGAQS